MSNTKEDETVNKLQQISGGKDTMTYDGVEFEIDSIMNEELWDLITEMHNNDDTSVADIMKNLCIITLQRDDSEITPEDFDQAPIEFTFKYMEKVEEVNGLQDFFSEAEIEEAKKQL